VNGDRMASQPDISVITTMYRSEPYVEEFYRRVVKTIQKLGINSYEIVFVDDGSPDHSRGLALQLYARDPNVVVVDLSRNFGHHKAIMAGLSYTRGRRIFLLDCDLEEDPELLEQLLISGIWHLTGYEQVAIPAIKHSHSPTSYPLRKRFALMLMSIISYSDRPLRWMFYTGLGIFIFAFFYIAYVFGVYLLYGIPVPGYLSIILSLWLIGGLNFLFLGTIGLYVATIFSETKQRPSTIVRAVHRHENEQRAPA